MIARIFRWLFTAPAPATVATETDSDEGAPRERAPSFFTTEFDGDPFATREQRIFALSKRAIPKTIFDTAVVQEDSSKLGTFAMDDSEGGSNLKAMFTMNQVGIPEVSANWYGAQGFIGYQLCALIAQHWLVNKACVIPARDAVRKGYKFTANDGETVSAEVLAGLAKANKRYKLNHNLVQFVKMGRVFGIRIAFCKIETTDPDFYVKPFNPDAITPGSYKGIVQVDPYWVVPELSNKGASDPDTIDFYEPENWIINGKRYHKSHLVIMRGPEVADILKPSYLYGGISVPQMIYERVYAAERTANEAPQLALSKRTTIFYTDASKALANIEKFTEKLLVWCGLRDNYGAKVADKDGDKIEQMDTSLADLDVVIMSQYQLVAAECNIPATKLLGTTPKGFNASGTYEEDSYHEELESIQVNDMEPLIDRHTACLIRSEIAPKFNVPVFSVDCTWEPLDSVSSSEAATVNKTKAETDQIYVNMGAIDGTEVRKRIAGDELSGHNGLPTLENDDVQTDE
jgi:uncharacterized protein